MTIFLGVLLGVLLAVLFFGWLFLQKKQEKEEKEKQLLSSKKVFYIDCEKAGIVKLDSAEKREKARLFAQRAGFDTSDLDALFDESARLIEADRKEEQQRSLEKLKKEEAEKFALLTQYAEFTGRDKRIKMLSDKQAEYLKKLADLGALDGDMMRFAQHNMQREKSWGLYGGIASGIAGPAAGLAAALDVQSENAQIRAQNDAMISAVVAVRIRSMQQKSEYERMVKEYEKKIEDTKVKLVSDIPKEELFKKLTITSSSVKIADSGAFTIKATVNQKEEFYAFESVHERSTIDGTLSAELYQKGNLVGSALLVFPVDGIVSRRAIEGMGLSGAKKGVPYELRFKPYHLWAMER